MIYRDGKVTLIKFWKFEMKYEEGEKSYFGNWKWGDRLVGSFTLIK